MLNDRGVLLAIGAIAGLCVGWATGVSYGTAKLDRFIENLPEQRALMAQMNEDLAEIGDGVTCEGPLTQRPPTPRNFQD